MLLISGIICLDMSQYTYRMSFKRLTKVHIQENNINHRMLN